MLPIALVGSASVRHHVEQFVHWWYPSTTLAVVDLFERRGVEQFVHRWDPSTTLAVVGPEAASSRQERTTSTRTAAPSAGSTMTYAAQGSGPCTARACHAIAPPEPEERDRKA